MQTHQIVLGLNIPNSGTVTNQMWMQFVQDELLTRLQFCTISDAIGVYKGTLEKTKIIEVTVDERTTHSDQIVNNLKKVGDVYKQQFRQDCVLYRFTNVEELVLAWVSRIGGILEDNSSQYSPDIWPLSNNNYGQTFVSHRVRNWVCILVTNCPAIISSWYHKPLWHSPNCPRAAGILNSYRVWTSDRDPFPSSPHGPIIRTCQTKNQCSILISLLPSAVLFLWMTQQGRTRQWWQHWPNSQRTGLNSNLIQSEHPTGISATATRSLFSTMNSLSMDVYEAILHPTPTVSYYFLNSVTKSNNEQNQHKGPLLDGSARKCKNREFFNLWACLADFRRLCKTGMACWDRPTPPALIGSAAPCGAVPPPP